MVLKNGNNITGEIKEMRLGLLRYSTDDMSTVYIEWVKIKAIKSRHYFVVVRDDGIKFYGSLDTDTTNNKLLVVLDTLKIPLEILQVVQIEPIKQTFWAQLGASSSLGFSYTKASSVFQMNFSGDVSYRNRKNATDLNLNSILTLQKDKNETSKDEATLRQTRFFKKKWFATSNLTLERNSELGIDLRFLFGIGPGVALYRSYHSDMGTSVGLVLNREKRSGVEEAESSMEGYASLKYKAFRYHRPELDLTVDLTTFPGLTPFGRFRTSFSTELRWEIVRNLFWNFKLFFNSDNQPPEGSSKTDWNVVFSIGVKK